MDSRPWPEEMRHKLHQQKLPRAYIDRLVEELSDHLLDFQTETTSMDAQSAFARLGSTNNIAAAATHEFRRHNFAGRHPWLTFVVFPVAFVPLLFVSLLAALFALAWMMETAVDWLVVPDTWLLPSETTQSRLEWWVIGAFDFYARFVPFVIASWIFCRWGRHSRMRWWSLVACGIVAVTAGLLVTKSVPAIGDKPGMWMIGLYPRFEARQIIQLVAPLVIAAWMLLELPRRLSLAWSTRNTIAT